MQSQARGLILDPVSKSMLQARLLVKTNAGFVAVWLVESNIIITIVMETDTQSQVRGFPILPTTQTIHSVQTTQLYSDNGEDYVVMPPIVLIWRS